MPPSTNRWLVVLVVVATVAMALVREARFIGQLSTHTQVQFAFVVFGLNVMAALAGIVWTAYRRAWCCYLLLTVVCMIFYGSSPVSTALILITSGVRHLLAG